MSKFYFIPEQMLKNQKLQVRIEPFNSFMLTGTEKDWTKKIDTTEILQNYEGLPSKIIFSYNNDEEDYCLNTYLSQTTNEYGSMTISLPVVFDNVIVLSEFKVAVTPDAS